MASVPWDVVVQTLSSCDLDRGVLFISPPSLVDERKGAGTVSHPDCVGIGLSCFMYIEMVGRGPFPAFGIRQTKMRCTFPPFTPGHTLMVGNFKSHPRLLGTQN